MRMEKNINTILCILLFIWFFKSVVRNAVVLIFARRFYRLWISIPTRNGTIKLIESACFNQLGSQDRKKLKCLVRSKEWLSVHGVLNKCRFSNQKLTSKMNIASFQAPMGAYKDFMIEKRLVRVKSEYSHQKLKGMGCQRSKIKGYPRGGTLDSFRARSRPWQNLPPKCNIHDTDMARVKMLKCVKCELNLKFRRKIAISKIWGQVPPF